MIESLKENKHYWPDLDDHTVENLLKWCSTNEKAVMHFVFQLDIDPIRVIDILNGSSHSYEDRQLLEDILSLMVDFAVQFTMEIEMTYEDFHNVNENSRRRMSIIHMECGFDMALDCYLSDSLEYLSFPGRPQKNNMSYSELLMLRMMSFNNEDNENTQRLKLLAREYYWSKIWSGQLSQEDREYFRENSNMLKGQMDIYRKIMAKGMGLEIVTIDFVE